MHVALKEKIALHIIRAAAIPLPSRQIQTTCKKLKKDECLLQVAPSFECGFATLSNINTSLGKAVFSGTLEKQTQLACVVSGGIRHVVTFQRENQIQTPSRPENCKTQNICTYLQIIAF